MGSAGQKDSTSSTATNGLPIAYRNIAFELMKSGEVIEYFSSVNGLFKSIPVLIIYGDKRKGDRSSPMICGCPFPYFAILKVFHLFSFA